MGSVPIPSIAPRLDRWNRYVISPPNGEEPGGYTRVTTVAKATDDGGSLGPWKSTMAIVGMFNRRGLMAQWETLIAETNRDPWYSSPNSKARCKALVEECATAGGSADSAEVGTSLHALAAMVDRGIPTPGLSPATEADLTAYTNALIEHGIMVDPEYVEVVLTLDAYRVAGSADRFRVVVPGFDEPLVGDIKTGQDLQYSWQSIAIQLAAYANAESQYHYGARPADDTRSPLPAVSRTHALVIHLPAGQARCTFHVIDIAAGWEAFKLALAVREWRTRKSLAAPLGAYVPLSPAALSKSRHPSGLARTIPAPRWLGNSQTERLSPAPTVHVPPALRAWLQRRIDVVGDIAAARVDLLNAWPAGVPSLKKSTDHSIDQLATIERILDTVEAKYSVPFGESRPALNVIHAVFPNSTEMSDDE